MSATAKPATREEIEAVLRRDDKRMFKMVHRYADTNEDGYLILVPKSAQQ